MARFTMCRISAMALDTALKLNFSVRKQMEKPSTIVNQMPGRALALAMAFWLWPLQAFGGYIPIGFGHKFHICGDIVDEGMQTVLDTLFLDFSNSRPLIDLKGNIETEEYNDTITNGKFCVEARFCESLIARIGGERIVPTGIVAHGMSFRTNRFILMVERRARPLAHPNIRNYTLSADRAGPKDGFALFGDWHTLEPGTPGKDSMELPSAQRVFSAMGLSLQEKDRAASFEAWYARFGELVRVIHTFSPYIPVFEFPDVRKLVAMALVRHSDSLLLRSGPLNLVRPRFAPATLDSPVCYFGRMADPPPRESSLWSDSLLVAVGGKTVIDGFYLYLPWSETWGKAVLDTVVSVYQETRTIRFSLVTEPYGRTDQFEFFNSGESLWKNPYYLRRKCMTTAEHFGREKYPRIIKPGVKF